MNGMWAAYVPCKSTLKLTKIEQRTEPSTAEGKISGAARCTARWTCDLTICDAPIIRRLINVINTVEGYRQLRKMLKFIPLTKIRDESIKQFLKHGLKNIFEIDDPGKLYNSNIRRSYPRLTR